MRTRKTSYLFSSIYSLSAGLLTVTIALAMTTFGLPATDKQPAAPIAAITLTMPFPGPQPKSLPATIEAENFDRGGEGIAYHEIFGEAGSGIYRGNPVEGVDIQASAGASAGFVVSETSAGEWLSYSVNVPAAGNYELGVRYLSTLRNGSFHLEVDGRDVTGAITVAITGSGFRNIFKRADMDAGKHTLRLVIDSNSIDPETGKPSANTCDLDSISFRLLKAKTPNADELVKETGAVSRLMPLSTLKAGIDLSTYTSNAFTFQGAN